MFKQPIERIYPRVVDTQPFLDRAQWSYLNSLFSREGTKSFAFLMGTGLAVFMAVVAMAFVMADEANATRVRIWL